MELELNHLPSWLALSKEAQRIKKLSAQEICLDKKRFQDFSHQVGNLTLDFSKQRIQQSTLNLLIELAEESQLPTKIQQLLTGYPVNTTEERPALHTALRLPANAESWLDGENINLAVQDSLTKMQQLVERLHAGQWRGVTGFAITDVVNLGVGGSDLGPLMVTHALAEFKPANLAPLNLHFASTMDGSQLAQKLDELNPATTLFILSSKSFSTIDTLSNAATARQWLVNHLEQEDLVLKQHFIGVSAAPEKMDAWGIAKQHQLEFWSWVGGRYSLWSAIGLPIALLLGMDGFKQLLAGAHHLDEHFANAELHQNLPVLLALIGIWNGNFLNVRTQAVLPYDGRLKYLPNYLSQLEMESNGKSVNLANQAINYATCPVIWGELGPNAQHAFYQLLHQGTEAVNCDFIAPIRKYEQITDPKRKHKLQEQQRLTLANCFAQSRLLMLGNAALDNQPSLMASQDKTAQHLQYKGNQTSTTLLIDELTPYSLGQLLALYEHKVFVQAAIWQINPFDQWGVELGKQLALTTQQALDGLLTSEQIGLDPSTSGLISLCLQH